MDLLRALTSARVTVANEVWQAALRQVAEAAVSHLDAVGRKQRDDEWRDWRLTEKQREVDADLVANLLNLLGELGAPQLRAMAAGKFAARPAVFDPVNILVPALGLVHPWDDAATVLWEHSADFLLQRSERPPDSPTDWRQKVKLSCACAECRELQAFTLAPAEQTHRFRVRQERRQHLHQQIEKHRLDMKHVTDRKGSPQTLVCTKDRRSYQRRCDQYRRDMTALAALVELAAQSSSANQGLLKRIAAASARFGKWSPG